MIIITCKDDHRDDTSADTTHNEIRTGGSFHEYMGRTRYERLKRFIERARPRPSIPATPATGSAMGLQVVHWAARRSWHGWPSPDVARAP